MLLLLGIAFQYLDPVMGSGTSWFSCSTKHILPLNPVSKWYASLKYIDGKCNPIFNMTDVLQNVQHNYNIHKSRCNPFL